MMDLLKRFEEDTADDELALDEDMSDEDGKDDLASKLESMDLGKSHTNYTELQWLIKMQIMHHTMTYGLHSHLRKGTSSSGRSMTHIAIWPSNFSRVRSSRTRLLSHGGQDPQTAQRIKTHHCATARSLA